MSRFEWCPVMGRFIGFEPPLVDYESFEIFSNECDDMCSSMISILKDAIDVRRQKNKRTQLWNCFSQTDLLHLGFAEFDDLRSKILNVFMNLTHGQGNKFCICLCESILEVITSAARTYISTVRGIRNLNANLTIIVNYEDLLSAMVNAFYSVTGNLFSQNGQIGSLLYSKNFIEWEDWTGSSIFNYIPIFVFPRYLIALCMLNDKKFFKHKDSIALNNDVLFLISKYMRNIKQV